MRKNSFDRTGIAKVRSVYVIEGANADRLINLFRNKGITVYDVKKRPFSRLIFSISVQEDKKLFAIVRNLCYTTDSSINLNGQKKDKKPPFEHKNVIIATKKECGFNVIKRGTVGVFAPFYNLFKSIGVVVGVIIFTLSAFVVDDVIFNVEYQGSGKVLERQVENFLSSQGVGKFSRFSTIDTRALSNQILASNKSLSFAQCYKRGNRLVVELVLSQDAISPIKTDVYSLSSDVDGEIENIKIYRGNPLFSVGDTVKKGDVIVDGNITVNDKTTTTFVLAKVTIKACVDYCFSLPDNSEETALAFALAQVGEKQVVSTHVVKEVDGNDFLYKVKIYYRHILTVG